VHKLLTLKHHAICPATLQAFARPACTFKIIAPGFTHQNKFDIDKEIDLSTETRLNVKIENMQYQQQLLYKN